MVVALRSIARYESERADRIIVERFEFADPDNDPRIEWEHSKEFCYQHWMYDVVQRYDSSGVTVIYAYRDKRETEIVMAARSLADDLNRDTFGQQVERMMQLLTTLTPSGSEPPLKSQSVQRWCVNQRKHCSPHLDGEDPPPKFNAAIRLAASIQPMV